MDNDPAAIMIDDAPIAGTIPLPLHLTKHTATKCISPTGLPEGPDPIAGYPGPPLAITVEFEITMVSIPDSVDESMPAAGELKSMWTRRFEDVFPPFPVPMPEPHPELIALICESEIKTDPIDDLDPSPQHPAPVPMAEPLELFAVIVELTIVRLLISETPWLPSPVPMPEPHPELIAPIRESKIKTNSIDDLDR
jgi:hypothetical protein